MEINHQQVHITQW